MANKTLLFGLVILCALTINAAIIKIEEPEKPCVCMSKFSCQNGVVDG